MPPQRHETVAHNTGKRMWNAHTHLGGSKRKQEADHLQLANEHFNSPVEPCAKQFLISGITMIGPATSPGCQQLRRQLDSLPREGSLAANDLGVAAAPSPESGKCMSSRGQPSFARLGCQEYAYIYIYIHMVPPPLDPGLVRLSCVLPVFYAFFASCLFFFFGGGGAICISIYMCAYKSSASKNIKICHLTESVYPSQSIGTTPFSALFFLITQYGIQDSRI